MTNYFVPSKGISSWCEFLADPEKQWKEGYSAYELASCWKGAAILPSCVGKVFVSSENPSFQDVKVLYGFPKYKDKRY